ncbi:aldo/keto reductase [Zooshikella ganghwensis]|uniref:aldo/keto reductase n=1 Tax=Zooshikella ganghwensis TaxID=202772 RepID=UPI000422B697|nr:aldo/keto reductase [Zooshikella ganghwensis]
MKFVPKVQMSPNGPSFSRLVQGYWRMNEWGMSSQELLTFIKQHIELGITTVDHAHVYGIPPCEKRFGEALKLNRGIRDSIEIVSKCGIQPVRDNSSTRKVNHYNTSKKYIIESAELSLQRLGIDFLDVLLIHRPDFLMSVDEVADAFRALYDSGKVKHFGVSNFTPSQFSLLQTRLDFELVTNQVEINPLNMSCLEDGTLDQLQALRVKPMAWSCLAGSRILLENTEQAIRIRSVLSIIADEIQAASIAQVLYAWVLRLPTNPVALLGSGKIERITSGVESLNLQLTHEQWYRIWVAAKGHNVP